MLQTQDAIGMIRQSRDSLIELLSPMLEPIGIGFESKAMTAQGTPEVANIMEASAKIEAFGAVIGGAPGVSARMRIDLRVGPNNREVSVDAVPVYGSFQKGDFHITVSAEDEALHRRVEALSGSYPKHLMDSHVREIFPVIAALC